MGRSFMLRKNIGLLLAVMSVAVFAAGNGDALAQNSLGLGNSEQAIRPEGMFAEILLWIQQQQQEFYKLMTDALKTIQNDGNAIWYLTGLSFAYGVLHAAGPGHGKAVISSYMLANEVAARRGIMLSFASALLQGLTAVLIMGAIILFLRGTGIKSGNLSGTLTITSYFLVMLLGIYLLWIKIFKKKQLHAHAHEHAHHHDHSHHDHNHTHPDPHHVHTDDCGCGHSHAADPKMLEGKNLSFKEAWSAVLAVGVRPCTGAIVVLSFAFLNSLYLAGVTAVLAMSIGTGITVAIIAIIAVTAKNTAVRIAGAQDSLGTIHRVIEISGAALVFLLGFLLFTAALTV